MYGRICGSRRGTLILRPELLWVAEGMRNIRVLTLKRAKAWIQVLLRHVGIVMIWHQVQPRPLFLTLGSCYRTRHVIWIVSRILPVQQLIFTNLRRGWRRLLISFELFVGVSRMKMGILSKCGIRLKLSGWQSGISLFFYSRNLGFLSQFISQRQIGLVYPLRMVELTLYAIRALFFCDGEK